MLFRNKIEPRCAYCAKGTSITDDQIACIKKGIVSAAGCCGKFSYDPLKRVPSVPAESDFSALKEEDFSL